MYKLLSIGLGLGLLAASCNGPTTTLSNTVKGIMVTAEGPCFEGSNTAIGEWDFELASLQGMEGYTNEDLKNARIKSVTVYLDDEKDAGLVQEVTLQITAAAADMKKVAFLNPVPESSTSFALQVAESQEDLVELFKQGLVTVVADVNINSDYEDNLVLLLDIEFELDVKNKK